MSQYRYHTEAMIAYMQNYLEEFHYHKQNFSRFHASKSKKKFAEDLNKQCTLIKQEERESDHAGNNLSAAGKPHHIDKYYKQLK